jgi:hypothetical protein
MGTPTTLGKYALDPTPLGQGPNGRRLKGFRSGPAAGGCDQGDPPGARGWAGAGSRCASASRTRRSPGGACATRTSSRCTSTVRTMTARTSGPGHRPHRRDVPDRPRCPRSRAGPRGPNPWNQVHIAQEMIVEGARGLGVDLVGSPELLARAFVQDDDAIGDLVVRRWSLVRGNAG